MSDATAVLGNTVATFFNHFFGPGLTDDRYVIEKAQPDQSASSDRFVFLAAGRRRCPFPFLASASAPWWQRRPRVLRASLRSACTGRSARGGSMTTSSCRS